MARIPLLMDNLSEAEQVALSSLVSHPSYTALEKMLMASCDEVNRAFLKLDPSDEGYDRKVKALQAQASERNNFCLMILESINYHAQVHEKRIEESKEQPQQNRILKDYINGRARNTNAGNAN